MTTWLPSAGLLREHYEYGTWCTDAPPVYHVAAMVTAMASLCADNAKLVIENAPFPLHVWTMLVGKSTVDRKTTSTRLAISRVEAVTPNRVQRIYGSPEGIMQGMVSFPCICLYVPEGGAFFAQREASYWRHARDIFMDLYDYTDTFTRRLVKETISVKNPRISILAACAYPLLERYTRDTDWVGGFLARFLMIGGEPQAFKSRMRHDTVVEKRIEDALQNVLSHDWGTMGCTGGARRILDDFAAEIHAEVDTYAAGLAPSLNRLPEMSNRLAGLFEIAYHAPSPPPAGKILLVSLESAQCAVALCRTSRDDALRHLGELTVAPGVSRELARVEGIIRRSGIAGIDRTILLRATRVHAKDLDRIMHTLCEQETVTYSIHQPKTAQGRVSTRIVHIQAAADVQRLAEMSAEHDVPISYIDLTKNTVHIDTLPVHKRVPLGVPFHDVDDE